MEKQLASAELPFRVLVDSAGTHAYHAGEAPDRRAVAAAENVGIDLSHQRARAITDEDFASFDYIVAMDKDNMFNLSRSCPRQEHYRISSLMDYAPPGLPDFVPDPYYGTAQGFTKVIELTLKATEGLLNHIKERELGAVI